VLEEMFVGMPRTHPEPPLTPTSTIANMLRGFIVGPLIVGDLSQIEARGLNWLAGQQDTVELFATGGDPYCAMASRIYGRPISKKHDPDERFMGKQAILGCFAADTMVLTDTGWRPIVDVRQSDKLWDGEEWVTHGGVVCQGEKDVLCWQEIGVTPDHRLLTREGWAPASQVAHGKAPLLASALSSGNSAWKATSSDLGEESPRCEFPAHVIASGSIPSIRTTSDAELLRAAMHAQRSRPLSLTGNCIGATPTSCPTSRTGNACSTESLHASRAATTHGAKGFCTTEGAAFSSTSRGEPTAEPSCATCSPCQGGTNPSLNSTERMSIADTSPGTSASSPTARTCRTSDRSPYCNAESQSLRRRCVTYDIALAGPRSRFTILTAAGPVVAHNCGYGLGAGGFQFMLDDIYDRQIDIEFAQQVVDAYRAASPKVVAFWKRLNDGFLHVVRTRNLGARFQLTRNIAMGMTKVGGKEYAFIELPSSRRLYYAEPRIVLKTPRWKGAEPREVVEYWGRDLKKGGAWCRVTTYGGKLAENVTQAFSRDVIAFGMLNLRDAGFHLNGTVHDELIAEDEPTPANVKRFHDILVQVPEWAPGLPLEAEVFAGARYRK
jgi:DNA polymerase